MHTQLQGIESIFNMVWIVNHRNKFITGLHTYISFFIFLNINLKAIWDSLPDVPRVSNEKVCSRKLDIGEFLSKQEILNNISRKNLMDNVFQTEEGFTLTAKQLYGCFRSFRFKLWTKQYTFLVYGRSMDSLVCFSGILFAASSTSFVQ